MRNEKSKVRYHPTGPLTIVETRNHEIVDSYVVQKRRAADVKTPKLENGLQGHIS